MYDMKICLFKNELNANVYLVLYRLLSGLDLSSLKLFQDCEKRPGLITHHSLLRTNWHVLYF